jgi:hypothetical protein
MKYAPQALPRRRLLLAALAAFQRKGIITPWVVQNKNGELK